MCKFTTLEARDDSVSANVDFVATKLPPVFVSSKIKVAAARRTYACSHSYGFPPGNLNDNSPLAIVAENRACQLFVWRTTKALLS